MKRKTILIGIVIALLFPSGNIYAQTNVETRRATSLPECIEIALQNNLTLKSGRIAIERAKELQGTAFNMDKTGFSMSQDPTAGGSPDNSLSVSQSFAFPTVYTTRHGLLKAETNLEKARLEVSVNELVKEITGAYYQLLHAKENIKILREQDRIYQQFVFLASTKFNSGETNRLEVMQAERLYNENKMEMQKAGKELQNIQLTLQQWLNTGELIEPQEDSLPVMVFNSPLHSLDISQTPSNRIYESRLKVSEKNLSLQRQEFLPDFNFSLRNQFLLKGFNPYSIERERFEPGNFMGFEVGISLPLFFGEQRAKTRAAQKEVEMLRTEKEQVLSSLQKEYKAGINAYENAKANVDYYINTGNKQAEEMARISQLAYEKGEIGYVEYIQNLKTVIEIHWQYANAVNELNQVIIKLNAFELRITN
ncbi:transporter [Clostridia bacterium]|nr:transporter [Clostridia bacterium]